jgi:hypothetical protein
LRDNLPTALPFNFFSPARLLFGSVMGALPLVDSAIGVWLYGGLFGITDGMQHALLGSAYAHYFGRLHHGTIRGLSNTLFIGARFIGGTAIGPAVLSLGPDILGGFAPHSLDPGADSSVARHRRIYREACRLGCRCVETRELLEKGNRRKSAKMGIGNVAYPGSFRPDPSESRPVAPVNLFKLPSRFLSRWMMDHKLQWVEGEFLAIEALRQGGKGWLFPLPPRSSDELPSDELPSDGLPPDGLPKTTERATVVNHPNLQREQEPKDNSSRPEAKHFVD